MQALIRYRLRWERRYGRLRAWRRQRELAPLQDRTRAIRGGDILVLSTLRNERIRLPYFLRYYRDLGATHFLIVDNESDDGSAEYLGAQADVSVWRGRGSYRRARFGMDWLNWLLARHGHGRWCLTVDPDEFLVYPFCDSRPLRALTDWLDASSVRSFPAMLLDMYPRGPIEAQPYAEGQDPFEIADHFDSGNYMISRNALYRSLWIQGGPRARAFFADRPERAPALNKIPLVKWHRTYAYTSSTHMLLPRGLNATHDEGGGEKASGVLLHAKFLNTFPAKAAEELTRRQHYAASHEYRAYDTALREGGPRGGTDLWCKCSERYINWRQLEILGLISKGNWA